MVNDFGDFVLFLISSSERIPDTMQRGRQSPETAGCFSYTLLTSKVPTQIGRLLLAIAILAAYTERSKERKRCG
jgi:hypothetical protein